MKFLMLLLWFSSTACYSIGVIDETSKLEMAYQYYKSRGENFSPEVSYKLFESAKSENAIESMAMMYVIFDEFPEQLKSFANEALNSLMLSAKDGFYSSQVNLGIILSEGRYLKKDVDHAIEWLELAVKQKSKGSGAYLLGMLLASDLIMDDLSVDDDLTALSRAVSLIESSIDYASYDAYLMLSHIYFKYFNNDSMGYKYGMKAIELDTDAGNLPNGIAE